MRLNRFVFLGGLLLASSSPVGAQIPVAPPAGSPTAAVNQVIAAYNELYRLYVAERKPPEEAVLAKVLDALKAHYREIPDAFLKAGDFYFQLGDAAQAMRAYQEGMAADSGRTIDYQKRVIEVLIRQGKSAEAQQINQDILQTNPRDPDARALEASFRLDKGDVEGAATELQAVLAERPESFFARYSLGRAWFARGDLDKARDQFEWALKMQPNYMPAQLSLAQLALRKGDPDGALKYAQAILKTNPNSGAAALVEASALVRKGEFPEARGLIERILSASPNQVDTLLELGVLELAQKRYHEAEEPFRKALQVDAGNLRALLGIMEAYFRQNDPDNAVKVLADAVQKQPERRELRKELATAEARAGKYDQAVADYQATLEKYKDSPIEQAELYFRMGTVSAVRGDSQGSIVNLQKARQLAPSNIAYAITLGQQFAAAGKRKEAVETYREALKIDSNHGIVMNNLAYLLIETGGDLDEALALALHAKQQLPKMAEIADTVGWIYIKKHQNDEAIEIFRELTTKIRENSTFHYHYGLALAQKGDKAGALEELKAALQYKPNPAEESEINELIRNLS